MAVHLSLGLQKGRPSYRRLSIFVGHFCPPGSGFRIRIRIRIQWPDWIRIRNTGMVFINKWWQFKKQIYIKFAIYLSLGLQSWSETLVYQQSHDNLYLLTCCHGRDSWQRRERHAWTAWPPRWSSWSRPAGRSSQPSSSCTPRSPACGPELLSYEETWPRSSPSGPRTDMSRTGIEPGHPKKCHSNSLVRYIYIWAWDMAPPSACVTWTYMNTHELH